MSILAMSSTAAPAMCRITVRASLSTGLRVLSSMAAWVMPWSAEAMVWSTESLPMGVLSDYPASFAVSERRARMVAAKRTIAKPRR
jgi:hypothetical protein